MTTRYTTGRASQALDINQRIALLYGRGVVVDGRPTEGARPYAVDITDATTYLGGDVIETPAVSIDLAEYSMSTSTQSRRVVIAIVPTEDEVEGEEHFRVFAGDPAEEQPDNAIRFTASEPSPPDLANEVAAPVAEVWIGGGAQQITDEDILDRRITPEIGAHLLTARTARFESITDGAGVEHTARLAELDDAWSAEAIIEAVNTDPDHASAESHNYFPGTHADLANVTESQHHAPYTDTESQDAVAGSVAIEELTGDSAYTPGQHLTISGEGTLPSGTGESTFGTASYGEPEGYSEAQAVWEDPTISESPVLATGTVTHTGGSSTVETIEGVTPQQTSQVNIGVGVSVAEPPGWDAAYGYATDLSRHWDAAAGEMDIELTLDWSTDPGAGNDLELQWTAYDLAPATVSELYNGSKARASVHDSHINVGGLLIGSRGNLPAYADPSELPQTPEIGDILVTSGGGTEVFGEWVYDGSTWRGPYSFDLTALSELTIDVTKSWGGFRIRNLGGGSDPGTGLRVRDIVAHTENDTAHHTKTTSSDIDHAGVSNVQSDQHHAAVTDDEITAAVAGVVMSMPVPATVIPDGHSARVHATIGPDETAVITRATMDTESGSVPSGLSLQVAEVGGSTVYHSQSNKVETGSADTPIATAVGPANLDIRVRNQTGSDAVAGGEVCYHIGDTTRTYGDTVTTPEDNESRAVSSRQGLVINPNVDMRGVRATISQNPAGYTTAYLQESGGGAVLAQEDISDYDNGDQVELIAERTLTAGNEYYVTMDADGAEYTRGKYVHDGNPFPYTSGDFDIVDGVHTEAGATGWDSRYSYVSVQSIFVEGS